MGRKVWSWIVIGLAVLVALAVTSAIWFGSLQKVVSNPSVPDTVVTDVPTEMGIQG